MAKSVPGKLSLSTRVMIGFLLGALTGVVFGELAGAFSIVGQAFVGLLQMTVLPYVVVSLIAGLGRLHLADARHLALSGGLVLAALSLIGLLLVVLVPLAFPAWEASSFFSTTLIEKRPPLDLLALYIPSNPFHALSDNIVPAVVLFCIAVGIALMGVADKQRIIDDMMAFAEALMRVTQFVTRLAPYGVFAIVASTTGTYDIADLNKLQVYVAAHTLVSLIATFLILPGLVGAFTSINFSEVIRRSWGALITAFATGNLLVVLPMLADEAKQLLAGAEVAGEQSETAVDVLVPASFNFPNLGKLLSLAFVLFGGWFIGSEVSMSRYPEFIFAGFFTFFGSVVAAIPFLLNTLQLPADLLELYVAVDVIASRFGTMLAAMNVMVLALLGGCAMAGALKLQPMRLLHFTLLSVAALAAALYGVRWFYTDVVHPDYQGYRKFVDMELIADPVASRYWREPPPPNGYAGQPALERVRQRGSLQICFNKDRLPYVFVNAPGQVVGFDIELAHLLARQLDVSLTMIRIEQHSAAHHLATAVCDLVMGGEVMTPDILDDFSPSRSYMDETMAFVVRDHRRDEFANVTAIKHIKSPRIGIMDSPYYAKMLRSAMPDAEIVQLESPRTFFRDHADTLDAMVFTAEAGSAWSLVYPDFSVVVPQPNIIAVPLVFLAPKGDHGIVEYLNVFIELKKKDGSFERIYNHWILGRVKRDKNPRWSVIRDVLHWID